MLEAGEFHSSQYRFFDRHERGKTRHIAALPFYPDRIVHWALILATEDVFLRTLVSRTYAAIPGRGTHRALLDLKAALRTGKFTHYLKIDVHHYFESIVPEALMAKLERRIKDKRILELYRRIVFEYPRAGIPIGNLTSQYLANLYLSDLDHELAERYHATAFRYMDDIVVLGWDKSWLRRVRTFASKRLKEIGLELNADWKVAPVEAGIDFVGYVTYPDHVLLRKRTKRTMARKIRRISNALDRGEEADVSMLSCVSAYHGILSWCDGHGLHRTYLDPVMQRMVRI